MQIREMSDIHNEFGILDLYITEADKERTLILAGDIDSARNLEANFHWVNSKGLSFKHVIYIAGNHEFYNGDFDKVTTFYRNAPWDKNVHFLDHEAIELDGIVFWGGTTWTGLANANPLVMQRVRHGMNDYRVVSRVGPYKSTLEEKTTEELRLSFAGGARWGDRFDPVDTILLYRENMPKIFAAVTAAKAQGKKIVVVTHHAPASGSIGRDYRGADMNEAYSMFLDNEVADNGPDLWFHGHVHASFNYECGKTVVYCNPRGYYKHSENVAFDQEMIVEI